MIIDTCTRTVPILPTFERCQVISGHVTQWTPDEIIASLLRQNDVAA